MLQQVLDNLQKKEHLSTKDFNKTTLYWINQHQFTDITPTKLTQVQNRINELTQRANEYTNTRKVLEHRIHTLQTSLTDEELQTKLNEYEQLVKEKEERLAQLTGAKSSSSTFMDPKEKLKLRASIERYRKGWMNRKNMVMDVLNSIAEGTGKKLSVLVESVGIETDKDAGVDIKDYTGI